jgi:predicted GNAT family N-acyltransferase
MIDITEISPVATHDLRRRVLRDGTASDIVTFDGDELDTTFHLGAWEGGRLVGISSWVLRAYPDRPAAVAFQLRGMATEPLLQGVGVGGALLATGLARCLERGATLVWARARDSALDFYARHGFEPVGLGYVDLTTGLPHHDVLRRLA